MKLALALLATLTLAAQTPVQNAMAYMRALVEDVIDRIIERQMPT